MKIRSLKVYGYGMLSDTGIDEIRDGLLLLEGTNGAGKSTFLEFVKSLLFGYPRAGAARYGETPGGLRGGFARLEMKDGKRVRWERGSLPPATGSLSVIYDGFTVDPGEWLGSADRELYTSVFALSLDELRDDAMKTDRQEAIEAAITGTSVQGLPAAIKRVDVELKDLQKKMAAAQRQVEDASQDLERAKKRTRLYDVTLESARAAKSKAEELTKLHSTFEPEAIHLQRLQRAWHPWCEYETARVRLGELPLVEGLDEGALERLRGLREREARLHRDKTRSQEELVRASSEREGLVSKPQLLSLASTVESLLGTVAAVREAEFGMAEKRRLAEEGERSLSLAMADLGSGWDVPRLDRLDTSMLVHSSGLKLAQAVAQAEAGLRKEHEEADARARDAKEAEKEASEFAHAPPLEDRVTREEIDRRQEALELLRTAVVERDALETERIALIRASQLAGQPVGSDRRQILLLLGFLALILIVAGLMSRVYVLVAAGFLVGVLIPFVSSRYSPGGAGPHEAANEIRRLGEALTAANGTLHDDSSQEGWRIERIADLVPVARDLQKRRDELSADEASRRRSDDALRRSARAAERVLEALERVRYAEIELKAANAAWQEWLSTNEYPSDLAPEGLGQFQSLVVAARGREETARKARVDEVQALRRIEEAHHRIETVRITLGEPIGAGGAADQIVELGKELQQARDAEHRRTELDRSIASLESHVLSAASEELDLQNSIAAIHRLASVDSDSRFEEAFRMFTEAKSARADLERARAVLTSIGGPGDGAERLIGDLARQAGKIELETAAAAAQEKLDEIGHDLRSAEDEVLKLESDLRHLEEGADLGASLGRRADHQAEVESIRSRWTETALTKILLAEARERFQTQVQESVFDRASFYMKSLTAGRSETVRKEGETYIVLDKDGSRRSVSQLNRSHAERLLLAVRLGYVDHYADAREPLPIVLDDILVNFDPYHQKLAVDTILEVAERHQVIYLTCHPATRELFAAAGVPFQHVRLNQWRFDQNLALPDMAVEPIA